jgi:hypothetical protein
MVGTFEFRPGPGIRPSFGGCPSDSPFPRFHGAIPRLVCGLDLAQVQFRSLGRCPKPLRTKARFLSPCGRIPNCAFHDVLFMREPLITWNDFRAGQRRNDALSSTRPESGLTLMGREPAGKARNWNDWTVVAARFI